MCSSGQVCEVRDGDSRKRGGGGGVSPGASGAGVGLLDPAFPDFIMLGFLLGGGFAAVKVFESTSGGTGGAGGRDLPILDRFFRQTGSILAPE